MVDGEPQRVVSHAELYPNTIRVEEPVITHRFLAVATNPTIHLDGWDSLKDTSYRVEYGIGGVTTQTNLERVVKADLLSAVPSREQGLKKLKAGRTDIFVEMDTRVLPLIETPEFKDAGIVTVGVMQSKEFYPQLHKKHSELAPKLAEVLRQMKAEGVYERLQKETMPFLSK